MATATQTPSRADQGQVVEQKIQKLKELYADAPELGKVALEKGLPDLKREFAAATGAESAGRRASATETTRADPPGWCVG